jgi:hypothetical protein
MKVLAAIGVPFFVIVEREQFDAYASVIDPRQLLILPTKFQEAYDTFDREQHDFLGPGPARNFAWAHSIEHGAKWHWVIDDNINTFYRLNDNQKIRWGDGAAFRFMEEFCLRYRNVAMAGPNYATFVPRKYKFPPFVLNTRIYSCNLIRNDIALRWRGRYNEDTDLSLRMLKGGWCTVQFNAFLQSKAPTQTIKGGNTDMYLRDGTVPKSEMLAAMHPDVTKLVWKYGRPHHHVDYRGFKQQLVLREPSKPKRVIRERHERT